MTNYECEILFLQAMNEKRIVCFENKGSKDHYHIHAYRRDKDSITFFGLVETFFRSPENTGWLKGSIRSFHEFSEILGATSETLILTEQQSSIMDGFESQLPLLSGEVSEWIKAIR
ncbi:MAG TPA: hypothetical protein VGN64_05270 [Dyadobacter sp.]|jgi:hypothetical protein|nr:hypothetical protein [Dyadobacter sp.]